MNTWIIGTRPRTLPAAVVPVAVGAACAVGIDSAASGPSGIVWWRLVLCAVVALALQVGTNFANDYSDGVRGTDDARVGPVRLVASGLKSPSAVKRAAMISFATAALCGLALALATTLWLVAVGGAAIAAGWFYTGGPRPYGYAGLGELFVFVFFGLVATAGTTFVLRERITTLSIVAACAIGFVICALLVINNLRDIPTDRLARKRTLAVRIGDRPTRVLYVALIAVTFIGVAASALAFDRPWALLGVLGVAAAAAPCRAVLNGASGKDLIGVLGATGRLQLITGALFTLGLAISG